MSTDRDERVSDDELNYLESKSQDKSLDYVEVDEVLRRVPVLCKTIRGLRETDRINSCTSDLEISDNTKLTATAMRDRCVSEVTELYEAWCLEARHRGNDLKNLRGVKGRAKADAAESIITTLKSLTLEGEQEKSK